MANEIDVLEQVRRGAEGRELLTSEAPETPAVPETLAAPEDPAQEIPAEETPAAPEAPAQEIDFAAMSGGLVKSKEDLLLIKQQSDLYQAALKENNALKAQSEVSPFADPMSKELNDLIAKGATKSELANFLSIQDLDVSALSESDVLLRYNQLKYPTLTDPELRSLVSDRLDKTKNEDGETILKEQALLKIELEEAKSFIENKKILAGEPETVKKARIKAQQNEQLVNNWKTQTETIVNSQFSEFKIPIPGEKDVFGTFNLPEDSKSEIVSVASKYLADHNIELNVNTQGDVAKFIEGLVMQKHGREIVDSAIKAAVESAKKNTIREQSGLPAERGGSQTKPVVESTGPIDPLEAIRKRHSGR